METDRHSYLAVSKKPLNKGFFALADTGSRPCSSGKEYFRMSTKENPVNNVPFFLLTISVYLKIPVLYL
jgi:hypothetical protein